MHMPEFTYNRTEDDRQAELEAAQAAASGAWSDFIHNALIGEDHDRSTTHPSTPLYRLPFLCVLRAGTAERRGNDGGQHRLG